MEIIGYLVTFLSLYMLYVGEIVVGGFLFILGGVLAKKVFFCVRSFGVVVMVISIAYGYHTSFSPYILFIVFIGFVMACFNTRRTSDRIDSAWGIDFDLSSLGSDSSDSGGFDGGGD